jgi:hypothetical protein
MRHHTGEQSGDSYLRKRQTDGAGIFTIKDTRRVGYLLL